MHIQLVNFFFPVPPEHYHPPPQPPQQHPPPPQPSQAGESPKEELLLEIKRLRERIKCLEGDNATMHFKLTKTEKDVDRRLAEIEAHVDHVGVGVAAVGGGVAGAGAGGVAGDAASGGVAPVATGELDLLSSASASCSLNSTVEEEEEDEEKNRESFI